MRAKAIQCSECGQRMWRLWGYKKAFWKCEYGYRSVYECPACKTRLALVTMDEEGYLTDLKERGKRITEAEKRISELEIKLYYYRENINVSKFLIELDFLEKQLNRLRKRLKEM